MDRNLYITVIAKKQDRNLYITVMALVGFRDSEVQNERNSSFHCIEFLFVLSDSRYAFYCLGNNA